MPRLLQRPRLEAGKWWDGYVVHVLAENGYAPTRDYMQGRLERFVDELVPIESKLKALAGNPIGELLRAFSNFAFPTWAVRGLLSATAYCPCCFWVNPIVQLSWRLADAFPRVRQMCTLIHDEGWRDRVEEAIRDYCARSLSGAAPVFGRSAVLRAGPMTLKQVATRLGTRVETVACAIDAHGDGFRGKRVTAQGRQRRIVDESDLLGLETLLREDITTAEAARLLALPVSRVRAIVRSGVLREVNGRLTRSQVLAFAAPPPHVTQVTAGAPASRAHVRQALRDWVALDDTGAFLTALRSGQVLAKRELATDSLGEWLMSAAGAKAWAQKHRLASRASLTLTRAAAVLAVKQDVVRDLVRTGLLSARRAALGGRQGWWIEPSHLHAFKERYVPLAHLAKEAGVRNRDGFAWAQHEGLNVVTGPRVDGSRQYFVDRRSNTAKREEGKPVDQLCVAEIH